MYQFQEMLVSGEYRRAEELLNQAGLDLPQGITYGLGAYADDKLAGTAFLAGNVVCGICVSPEHQGSGLAASLVSRLIAHALELGQTRLMVFTKPAEAFKFEEIGFRPLAATESAVLLEWGRPDYQTWVGQVRSRLEEFTSLPQTTRKNDLSMGAVVMNANPFTLGHRHLVLQALTRCQRVVVFVVEEDASVFPFAVRLRLVQEGLADVNRVTVLSGGPYMVSRATFPSYFTGQAAHGRVHAELDCTLFAARLAPDLGIDARFVGEEPYCEVTALYNRIMNDTLPRYGIACVEIPRLVDEGAAISASSVRALLRNNTCDLGHLADLVPASTLTYLSSPEAEPVLAEIRRRNGRH